jgi:5-formyltetrahydrofolate cyclo-ligase
MNTYFLKKELRGQMRKRRDELTGEEKQRMSGEILRKIKLLDEYNKAEILFTYVSFSNEVDTFALIAAALKSGKRVAVPRCIAEKPVIEFYFIHGKNELERGNYGILEPRQRFERLCTQHKGLCVLPGLCFDRMGTRLGYGKGYYDRFLQKFEGDTVGVCFSPVLADKPLPTGRFDIPADIVVTDNEVIRVKG